MHKEHWPCIAGLARIVFQSLNNPSNMKAIA